MCKGTRLPSVRDLVWNVYRHRSIKLDMIESDGNVDVGKAVYPWDSTIIGAWSRIGAQCHIDHGAKIKELVEICARCTISGRTNIERQSFIGFGTVVSNRIIVRKNSKVLIGSVVTKDVNENETVSGNFAISHDRHLNRVVTDSKMVLR